ncbi:hypothetical protein EBR96_07990, partial [bacterium]|nr:hypothetical protein [bacterium]
ASTSSIFVDTQAPAIQELPRNSGPLTFGQYDLPVLISEPGTAITASMNGVMLTESSRVPSGSGEIVAMRYLVDSNTPQGQNSIRLTATDRAGNRTQTDINAIIVDTISPSAKDLPSGLIWGPGAQSFRFSLSEPVVAAAATVNGQVAQSTILNEASGSQLQFNVSIPTDSVQGTAAIQITAVDAAGNRLVLAPDFAVIDTMPPAIQTTISQRQINRPEIELVISSEPGSRVQILKNGYLVGEIIQSLPLTPIKQTLQLGPNAFRFLAVDQVGNQSEWTPTLSVVYRLDPPKLTKYALSANPARVGRLRVESDFSEPVTGSIQANLVINSATLNAAEIAVVSDHLELGFDILQGLNGAGHIHLQGIQNEAGNEMSVDIPVELDTTVPSLSAVVQGIQFVTTGNLTFDALLSEQVVTISATLNNRPMHRILDVPSGNLGIYRFDYQISESDAQGTASIRIEFSDSAGNAGEVVNQQYYIDTVPPGISNYSVPTRPVSTGLVSVAFDISEETQRPDVRFNGSAMTLSDQSTLESGARRYRYSYLIPATEAQGTGSVTVGVQDRAGNSSASTSSIFVDTQAPAIQELPRNSGPLTFGQYDLPVLISEPGPLITASMNGVILTESDRVPSGSGEVVTMRFPVDSATPQGQNSIRLTATDRAGNRTQTDIN